MLSNVCICFLSNILFIYIHTYIYLVLINLTFFLFLLIIIIVCVFILKFEKLPLIALHCSSVDKLI